MNSLRDGKKSRVTEPGIPVLGHLRLADDVYDTLSGEKRDNESWAEFATEGMIVLSIVRRSSRTDLAGVIRLLVGIVGDSSYTTAAIPTDVGAPDARRTPRENSNARTVRGSDADARALLGATKLPH